jgi:hypothetical protein
MSRVAQCGKTAMHGAGLPGRRWAQEGDKALHRRTRTAQEGSEPRHQRGKSAEAARLATANRVCAQLILEFSGGLWRLDCLETMGAIRSSLDGRDKRKVTSIQARWSMAHAPRSAGSQIDPPQTYKPARPRQERSKKIQSSEHAVTQVSDDRRRGKGGHGTSASPPPATYLDHSLAVRATQFQSEECCGRAGEGGSAPLRHWTSSTSARLLRYVLDRV